MNDNGENDPMMIKRRLIEITKEFRSIKIDQDGNVDFTKLDKLKDELIKIRKQLRSEIENKKLY